MIVKCPFCGEKFERFATDDYFIPDHDCCVNIHRVSEDKFKVKKAYEE